MRKCDKKVKKGQGKRRQSNRRNSNDGWVREVREWIKEDRVTLNTYVSSLDAQKSVLIDETETSNYFMR